MNPLATLETLTRRCGVYRLVEADRPGLLCHLLALDNESRRWRFGAPMSNSTILNITKKIPLEPFGVGLFMEGELKGCAQIVYKTTPPDAELAVSLSKDMRHQGWGAILVSKVLGLAKAQGVRCIDIQYLSDNTAMHRIACSYPGASHTYFGEINRRVELDLCNL
jgi:RimJ/RimL family protein N-acetyltransferase